MSQRLKCSILEATTHDMAWNGEPIGKGAAGDFELGASEDA
jgi:hypothetical protein